MRYKYGFTDDFLEWAFQGLSQDVDRSPGDTFEAIVTTHVCRHDVPPVDAFFEGRYAFRLGGLNHDGKSVQIRHNLTRSVTSLVSKDRFSRQLEDSSDLDRNIDIDINAERTVLLYRSHREYKLTIQDDLRSYYARLVGHRQAGRVAMGATGNLRHYNDAVVGRKVFAIDDQGSVIDTYKALLTSKWVEVQVGATRSYAIWAVTA